MPVDLSFQEMAAFGAIIAALAVLLLVVALVGLITLWIGRRVNRFRSFGIERTPQGSVQFTGFVEGAEQRQEIAEGKAFIDKTFDAREDENFETTN